MDRSCRSGNEHQAESNLSQTVWSAIPSRIDIGADVQKPIPSTLCSSVCKEHKDDRGSSLLSAKMRKTCGDGKLSWESLQIAMKDVCRSFRKNQSTDTELKLILGKKFMGYAIGNFSDFERQK